MEIPYPPGFDPRFGELKSDLALMRGALIQSHAALTAWIGQEAGFESEEIIHQEANAAATDKQLASLEEKLDELSAALARLLPAKIKPE